MGLAGVKIKRPWSMAEAYPGVDPKKEK